MQRTPKEGKMEDSSMESVRHRMHKNFSKELTEEILAMAQRLWDETKDEQKVEMRVRQHLMDHILNDLGSTMKNIATWPQQTKRGHQSTK